MRLKLYLLRLVFCFLFLFTLNSFAYADTTPNVILYVHGEGSNGGPIFHQTGNMSGNGLWAPGKSQPGTIRIHNNYSERIRVSSLGLAIDLYNRNGEAVEDDKLYQLFAQKMNLTVKRGNIPIFNNTIFDQSFFEMLHKSNSNEYTGYALSWLDRFNIGEGSYVDLEYTVHMDESAGNELQGLRAVVDFLINVEENPVSNNSNTSIRALIQEPLVEYPDISGHWAHDCIITLLEKEIIKGYQDGSIRPENFTTRAEAASLVGRALGLEPIDKFFSGYFDFLPSWAKGYIIATTQKGIFFGYNDFFFRPNQNITRQEIMAVLSRAYDIELEGDIELKFADQQEIGKWALDYVKAGAQMGLFEDGEDIKFRPKDYMTRAELFSLICKLQGWHSEHLEQ